MAAERVKFYKLLVLDVETTAAATLVFSTGIATITFYLTAGARRPVKLRMPATARGRYAQVTITPQGVMRLYGMTLYGRRVGESADASWAWVPGPVDGTSEDWTSIKLPIPPTSEEWSAFPLAIPPTSEDWTSIKLPIPPTSDEWSRIAVPIPSSSELPAWADLPMDR